MEDEISIIWIDHIVSMMYLKHMQLVKYKKGSQLHETLSGSVWELTGSNRRPSACKADALNQLS